MAEFHHAIKLKYKAKRLADRTQDPVNISQYKMIKNDLKCQIRSAKLGYLHSLLVRARQVPQFAATLWSEVNNIIGRQVIRLSVIDPAVSLDTINQFFRTIAISNDHQPANSYVAPSSVDGGAPDSFRFDRSVSYQLSDRPNYWNTMAQFSESAVSNKIRYFPAYLA